MFRSILALCFLLLFSSTTHAGEYDSLRPKFNYALLRGLKNQGEKNVLNLQVGHWVEYSADSGVWKESVERRDVGKNLYPPNRIMIVKAEGDYVDGKRSGEWKYYRSYGNQAPLKWDLTESWTYVMGHAEGTFKAYYSSGEVMQECEYKAGKMNGIFKSYTRDHRVLVLTSYRDGIPDGKTEQFGLNGVLSQSTDLHNGLYDGMHKEFYPNGQLRISMEYRLGKPWNFVEAYTRYGAPLDRGTLKDGTGICYEYNEGGTRIASMELVNGKFHGTFRRYYLNGQISVDCVYRNDTMNGVYRDFYPEGGLKFLKTIGFEGVDGPLIEYYRNGKIKSENIYRKGKLWACVYANNLEGKKLDCGNLKMGSGTLISYDDSGRIARKENYSFGLMEGITESYYPNGKLRVRMGYLVDVPHGEYRSYDEEGNLYSVYTYNEGLLDGVSLVYYKNGLLKEEAYYYRDRLWAIISVRDSTGKKLLPGNMVMGCGVIKEYFPNGALRSEVEMQQGMMHGTMRMYYRDGKKYGEYKYYQDSLVGRQAEYWHNGTLAAERITNENARSERLTQYHSNGKLWTVWEFENGLLWNVDANYDMQGVPHNKGSFSKGSGTVLRYDEKDAVIFEAQFVNGECLNCEQDTASLVGELE